MTTPHAPEGGERIGMGDVTYGPGEAEARAALLVCGFPNSTTRSIALSNLILSARAEGATAERARLAGMASEEDEDLVRDVADASAEIVHACEWGTTPDRKALETAKSLLLATLSARRVEAMEAAAKVCDDLAFLWHIEARQADVAQYANEFMVKVVALQVAADKIRALIPPAEGSQGVG